MYRIVLLRHGESIWNKENRFTGWTDVDLSLLGVEEAKNAGEILKKEGCIFDLAYTSVLKRAIETTNIVLREMNLTGIPAETGTLRDSRYPQRPGLCEIRYAWQLNERHYGALQGLNKSEMAKKYGEEQVRIWRRSFAVRPPELSDDEFEKQNAREIIKNIPKDNMPKTESLADCYERSVAYWKSDVEPAITGGKKILVSAHGNSLRAIVKYLDNVGDDEISNLNIPTGIPLVYELDENLKPIRHYYLGDQKEIAARIEKIRNQGKK